MRSVMMHFEGWGLTVGPDQNPLQTVLQHPQRPTTISGNDYFVRGIALHLADRGPHCNVSPFRPSQHTGATLQCGVVSIWQLGFIRLCARMLSLSPSQLSVCLTL